MFEDYKPPRPPDWTLEAACLDYDPDWWFPTNTSRTTSKAKAICATCPVRLECLTYALSGADTWAGKSYGIWGGLGAAERDQLRNHAA